MTERREVSGLSKPEILVDCLPVGRKSGSEGVKVYLSQLLKAVPQAQRERMVLLLSNSNREMFSGIRGYRKLIVPINTDWRFIRMIAQQVCVPLAAIGIGARVIFEPADRVALLSPCPVVCAVHSGWLNLRAGVASWGQRLVNSVMVPLSLWRASRIIAISEYVAAMLVQDLGISSDDVMTVYHGAGTPTRLSATSPPTQLSLQDQCGTREEIASLLFVGTLYPHKNVDRIIRALALLREREDSRTYRLVIVGANWRGQRRKLKAEAAANKVYDRVWFVGRVSDEELHSWYRRADVFVFLSECEGFGLPVLEAMKAGLPVVVCDDGAAAEIVGEGGIRVDGQSREAVADAVQFLVCDEDARELARLRGMERAAEFSWEKCANETVGVLNDVVQES